MKLVIVTALLTVCGAAKLDRSYLPPLSAKTAGGSPGSLLAPIEEANLPTGRLSVKTADGSPGSLVGSIEKSSLPTGSYVNDNHGVVVDAVVPGTRASGVEPTGLGAPRASYGSTDSKVGDAAFKGSLTGFGKLGVPSTATRIAPGFGSVGGGIENAEGPRIRIAPGFESIVATKASDDDKTRASTLKFANEISKENYSYGFETDNGISVGENGVAGDGIKANGEYSYKSDDGKVYSVSYTADKDGYKPHGSHLPTPPPIPKEIAKSLEDNAKDEAEGIVDDGSYDAQKYNDEGDYSSNNDDNNKAFTNEGGTASNSFVSQSKQAHFGTKPPLGFLNTGFQGLNKSPHFLPHATSNRIGINSQKTDNSNVGASSATATASTSGDVYNQQSPNFQNNLGRSPVSSAGNTAYSSATVTGSGIATAFASTSPILPNFKKEYLPPNFGTLDQFLQDSKFGTVTSKTSEYSSFQSATGLSSPTTPTKVPAIELSTPFVTNETPTVSNSLNVGSTTFESKLSSNTQSLHPSLIPQKSSLDSTVQLPAGEYSPQTLGISLGQANSNDASFGATPTKLSLNQKQGSDSSYYYNQPAKNFVTPVSKFQPTKITPTSSLATLSTSSNKESSNSFNTINPNSVSPTASLQSTQYSGSTSSSYYNGITQASISAFPTGSSRPSTQFESQTSQLGLKPHEQSISSQSQLGLSGNQASVENSKIQLGQNFVTQGQSEHSQYKPDFQVHSTHEYKKPFTYTDITSTSSHLTTNKLDQTNIASHGEQIGTEQSIPLSTTAHSSSSAQNQGSLYEYPKPSESLTTDKDTADYQEQNTDIKGQSGQQTIGFGQKPFGHTQTTSIGPSQSAFSSTFGSELGQKPSTSVGTSSGVIPELQSSSQFGQKPFGSQSATGSFQSTQLSSSTTSKFGQNTGIKGQSGQQTIGFGQKPFGSSQTTNFGSSQSSFGSTSGSELGQKPSNSVGTSSGVIPELQSSSQFGQKPFGSQSATGSFQSTQLSSFTASKFGQNSGIKGQSGQQTTSFGQKPFGSLQTTNFGSSQNAFGSTSGSELGRKPSTTVGTSSGVIPELQSSSQFGQKPFGSQSATGSFQSTQLSSSTTSKFGQNTGIKGQSGQQTTSFGQKPFGSSQTTNFGSSQSSFGSTSGSELGQKPSTSMGTSSGVIPELQSSSQFGQKPFGSQSATGSFQSTQLSSFTASKFGQNTGIKGQSGQQTTSFGQKPFGSLQTTNFGSSQNAFGSTSGSELGQKPSTSVGTSSGVIPELQSSSQFGKKPFGSQSATGSFQSTQLSSSTTSKSGQNTGIKSQYGQQTTSFSQKPFGSSQTINFGSSQSAFGITSGSEMGQKPLTSVGTSSGVIPELQSSSQFGQKPFGSQSVTGSFQSTQLSSSTTSKFGQNTGIKDQSGQQTIGFGQKPFGSLQTTNFGSSQSAFGSTSGSELGQKPSSSVGTSSGVIPKLQSSSQFGQKPFGSQSATGSFQSTQLSSSTASKFGQNTGIKGQSGQQTIGFGQKPFGSLQTTNFGSSQSAFGITSGSEMGQKPLTSVGTSSGVIPELQSSSQFGQKPFGSQSVTGSFQSTQLSSSTTSKFGQNTGIKDQSGQQTIGFGQKPFGSLQTTNFGSSHSAFGSTSGSELGQKPSSSVGTSSGVIPELQSSSQFGQKPFGSQSATGSFQSTQLSSSTASKFGQNTGIKGQSGQQTIGFGQKPFGSLQTTNFGSSQSAFGSTSGSELGQKPSSSVGTSSGVIPELQSSSQFGQKPFGSQSATGSFQSTQLSSSTASKFGQNTGIKGQSGQQTTSFGQKPFGSSQTTTFGSSQSSFGSTSGSELGQKPSTSVETSSGVIPELQSSSQFGQKPFGSQSVTGSFQSTQLSSSTTSKFGQNTGIKDQSGQQTIGFGQKPFGSLQTTNFGSSQSAFGITSGSEMGQKPLTSVGTSSGVIPELQSSSQFGQKPFGSQSVTGSFQSTQLSSSTTSKFGQNTGIKDQSGQQTIGFGQKPFGSLQTTNFGSSQSAFDSTSGSELGQKPSSSVGTSSGVIPQLQSSSQFGQKPFGSQSATGSFQSTQLSSSTASKFGQNTGIKGQSGQQTIGFGQKPFGSLQTTNFGSSQSAFGITSGSEMGQKPLTSVGTSSGVIPELQSSSQFGQKPFGSQSVTGSFQSTQLSSSTTSKFGQNTGIKDQSGQQTIGFGQKPFGSLQTTNFGSSHSAFGSTSGSELGQKPSSSVGTSSGVIPELQSSSQFGQKPFGSQSATGSFQSTQLSSSTASKFGQNTGIKGQSGQQTIGFGQKPFGSLQTTNFGSSQSAFGSTSGSELGQKPSSSVGTSSGVIPELQSSSQFGQKPFGSQSATGSFQSTQLSSSTASKFGQNTGIKGQSGQQTTSFGQKPFGSSQTTTFGSSQSSFGSTSGSELGQKPSTSVETSSGVIPELQSSSQFGQKPFGSQSVTGSFQSTQLSSSTTSKFGQNTGIKDQSGQQTIGFGQKPFGSLQTTNFGSSQSAFGSTSGSELGQKPSSSVGTSSGVIPELQSSSQFGQKPFGSQSATGSFQSTQLSSSTASKFGQNTGIKDQSGQQTIGFGQKPFGSLQTTNFGSSQSAFGSTSGSELGQKPSSSVGTSSGVIPELQSSSQFGQKPFGSQSATGSFQSTQLSSSTASKFGQNTGIKGQSGQQTTSFGQKPFGSSQTTTFGSSQGSFGSTSGSELGQNPSTSVETSSGVIPELQSSSQFGQKPFGSQSATGSFQSTQLSSSTASKFRQNTGIKGQSGQQTTSFGQKPFGSSQTSNFGSSQSAFGSTSGSELGQKPSSSVGTSSGVIPELQSSSQFGQKPFGSQSATGSFQSTQLSSSTTSKFGQNTGIKGQYGQQTTSFGQKPFGSSQTTNFGSSQSAFGSTAGSELGQKPPTSVGTSSGVIPELQSSSQFGQKPSGSQSAAGSFQSTQLSSSTTSKFGQSTGIKGQSGQQTIGFGQKPFGSLQTTNFGSSQNAFGSTSGSELGQKPSSSVGTSSGVIPELQSSSQFGQKPFGSQSATGSFQSTQLSSSTASKFGQNTGIKGQSGQQTIGFGQKPFGSLQTTNFGSSQSAFGSTSGSELGQKPSSSVGTSSGVIPELQSSSQFGQKPFGSQSATGSFQSSQLSSSTTSKFGQNTGIKGQSGQQTISFGQMPFGSTQTTSFGPSQSAFGSTSGSELGQNPSSSVGTSSGVIPELQSSSQFGQKPFGSQSATGSFQSTHLSSSTTFKFDQNTGVKGQSAQQTTSFGQKPFSSSQTTNLASSQSTFGSISGYHFGQKPLNSAGTTSGGVPELQSTSQLEQNSLDSQQQQQQSSGKVEQKPESQVGTVVSAVPLFQSFVQKQSGSQSLLGAIQSTQISHKSDSPSGAEQSQIFDKKPYINPKVPSSSYQYKSRDFEINKTPALTSGSASSAFSQSSQYHSSTQDKPFVNTQTYFPSQIDLTKEQIPKSTATAFASNIDTFGDKQTNQVSKFQLTQFGKVGTQTYQPLDSSFSKPTYTGFGTQDSSLHFGSEAFKDFKNFPSLEGFGNSQSLIGSTQFGSQPLLPTVAFLSKSHSTPSTQISFKQVQSQISSSNVPTLSQHSSQNSFGLPLKLNNFESFKIGSVQDSSQLGSTVSTKTSTPILNEKLDKNYVGNKEVFGGPRDPPKFDIKTGYHY